MSFETDFLSMMASTVSVAPLASRDMYGAPIFGTAVTSPAHITYRTRAVRTDAEDRVLSTAQVQLPPPGYTFSDGSTIPRLHEGDEVQLPDDGIVRHVLQAVTYTDDTGDHSQTLYLT